MRVAFFVSLCDWRTFPPRIQIGMLVEKYLDKNITPLEFENAYRELSRQANTVKYKQIDIKENYANIITPIL